MDAMRAGQHPAEVAGRLTADMTARTGGTGGVITLEDIIEELLGDIHDEFDAEEKRLQRSPQGTYTADARIDIEDLEETLEMEFPEDREYESLGGFLMEVAGEVPSAGWSYHHGDHDFQVIEADVNRVIRVRMVFPPGLLLLNAPRLDDPRHRRGRRARGGVGTPMQLDGCSGLE